MNQLLPPVIPPGLHRDLQACALQNDDMLQDWEPGSSFVGDGFHGHRFAAAEETIGGKKGLALASTSRAAIGASSVAGKERQDDPADLGNRQQSDNDFGRHGHEQADCISFACLKSAGRWRPG